MVKADREWIEGKFEDLRREVVKIQVDIATLKVKAGIWGLIGGAIPIVVAIGLTLIVSVLKG